MNVESSMARMVDLEKRVPQNPQKAYIQIIEAFRQLVQQKEFEKISVAYLSETANVSRKTFYQYFRDKNEVVEHIMYVDILKPMKQMRELSGAFSMPSQTIMAWLYERIYNDRLFYSKVSSFVGQNSFRELMFAYTMMIVAEKFKPLSMTQDEKEYSIYFYTSSHIMVLMKWIQDGMKITPQQMAVFYDKWTIPAILKYTDDESNTI